MDDSFITKIFLLNNTKHVCVKTRTTHTCTYRYIHMHNLYMYTKMAYLDLWRGLLKQDTQLHAPSITALFDVPDVFITSFICSKLLFAVVFFICKKQFILKKQA